MKITQMFMNLWSFMGLGPCNFYKLIIAKSYYFAWRHVEDMNNDNVLIFKIGHSRLYRVSPQKAEH